MEEPTPEPKAEKVEEPTPEPPKAVAVRPTAVPGKPGPNNPLERIIEMRPMIEPRLPATVPWDDWIHAAKEAVRTNLDVLRKCGWRSVFNALHDAAADGLRPNGREAFLVPRWDSKTRSMQCCYQPTAAGYIRRLKEEGVIKDMVVVPVYEKDRFELDPMEGRPRHRVTGFSRGAWVGTYACARLPAARGDKKDRFVTEMMSEEQIRVVEDQANQNARRKDGSPAWKHYPEEMSKKTVLRRLIKYHCQLAPNIEILASREDDLYDFQQETPAIEQADVKGALDEFAESADES